MKLYSLESYLCMKLYSLESYLCMKLYSLESDLGGDTGLYEAVHEVLPNHIRTLLTLVEFHRHHCNQGHQLP